MFSVWKKTGVNLACGKYLMNLCRTKISSNKKVKPFCSLSQQSNFQVKQQLTKSEITQNYTQKQSKCRNVEITTI